MKNNNETSKPTETVESLDKQISELQAGQLALESELAELPHQLQSLPMESGADIERHVQMRRRLDELPHRIEAQGLLQVNLYIRRHTAYLESITNEPERLTPAYEQAKAELETAQQNFNRANGALVNARADIRDTNERIAQQKGYLVRLREKIDRQDGTVVRSRVTGFGG